MLQILTPAENRRLTELDTVKAELQISGGAIADDTWLEKQIDFASAQIADILRRVLALESLIETRRFTGMERGANGGVAPFILSRRPIVSVASIAVNDVVLTDDEWQPFTDEVAGADGMASGMLVRLSDGGHPMPWRGKVVIRYDAGFTLPGDEDPTLPPALERACVEIVSEAYLTRGINPGVIEERIDGISTVRYANGNYSRTGTLIPGVSDDVARLLSPFIELLA